MGKREVNKSRHVVPLCTLFRANICLFNLSAVVQSDLSDRDKEKRAPIVTI